MSIGFNGDTFKCRYPAKAHVSPQSPAYVPYVVTEI